MLCPILRCVFVLMVIILCAIIGPMASTVRVVTPAHDVFYVGAFGLVFQFPVFAVGCRISAWGGPDFRRVFNFNFSVLIIGSVCVQWLS